MRDLSSRSFVQPLKLQQINDVFIIIHKNYIFLKNFNSYKVLKSFLYTIIINIIFKLQILKTTDYYGCNF